MSDTLNLKTEGWIPRHVCDNKVPIALNHEHVGGLSIHFALTLTIENENNTEKNMNGPVAFQFPFH